MNAELNDRENKVLDFINAINKEKKIADQKSKFENDPAVKMNKLNNEFKNATSVCIDAILGKIYQDALPFDDPKKNASSEEIRGDIHDYISNRTNGQNSEYYVKEAIRRTNSNLLKNLLTESKKMAQDLYKEMSDNIAQINLKDLNFNPNNNIDNIERVSKKLELDEIAQIIQNNVKAALDSEKKKAENEEAYQKSIEDALANDPNVVDKASMESAMARMNVIQRPTVYQPSLFEGILLGNAKHLTESTNDNIIQETVREYTKLNISKCLCLEKFDVRSVKNLANSYLK